MTIGDRIKPGAAKAPHKSAEQPPVVPISATVDPPRQSPTDDHHRGHDGTTAGGGSKG
jgi:hypothetical protein